MKAVEYQEAYLLCDKDFYSCYIAFRSRVLLFCLQNSSIFDAGKAARVYERAHEQQQ